MYHDMAIYRYIVASLLGNIILLCAVHKNYNAPYAVHYSYNALCGGAHEICSTAHSFDLRCKSVTFYDEQLWIIL